MIKYKNMIVKVSILNEQSMKIFLITLFISLYLYLIRYKYSFYYNFKFYLIFIGFILQACMIHEAYY